MNLLKLKIVFTTADIITAPFDLQFRLHTNIARHPWARIWYCIRALDIEGRGHYQIPLCLLEILSDRSEKSIYRLLEAGKRQAGAFRDYKIRKGILTVVLGGLPKVSARLNLKNWGTVAIANLLRLDTLKPLTTAAVTQKLQQRSRYAANRNLKPDYRRQFGAPHPNAILGGDEESSLKMGQSGQVPFLLHVSARRVFVSKSFVAFGTSQDAVSCNLGIHRRTVQRHQRSLGMCRRQLCQAKLEYGWINTSLEYGMDSYDATSTSRSEGLGYESAPGAIAFRDGYTPGAKRKVINQWHMSSTDELSRRLFKLGDKFWLAKCNLYRETLTLTTMRASRKEYQATIRNWHSDTFQKNAPAGVADVVTNSAMAPGNERHF